MNTFEHNNLTFEYEITGAGVPFVFIHGLGGDISQIRSVYQPIDGVQLITMNMQGHGNSVANYDNYTFNELADNVMALLDYLHIDTAYFGGISMGAAIATNIAIRYPKRVIELICIRPAWTHLGMATDVQQAYVHLANSLSIQDRSSFLNSEGWKIINETTDYTKNTFLHTFEEPVNIREWKKFSLLPFDKPYNSIQELGFINIPTTIIACKQDFVHPYEFAQEYHQYIKNSMLIEVPNKDTDSKLHNIKINEVFKQRLKVNL